MEFSRPEYWSGWPCPYFRGSSQPRVQTQVSCITGGFFTSWATREAHTKWKNFVYQVFVNYLGLRSEGFEFFFKSDSIIINCCLFGDCSGGTSVEESACKCREALETPGQGSGRSPGGGHGYSLQYSCLENPMDRGARWVVVHGVEQSHTTETT